MAKTFSVSQRVKVSDPKSPDHGREGVVASCDTDAHTCTVRLDGDTSDKVFECGQLDKCPV